MEAGTIALPTSARCLYPHRIGQGFSLPSSVTVLNLEVGHLPSVDISLEVGAASTVVEVTSAAPQIDVTTNVTQTNVTEDVIANIPHGRSFQSVIQFAPAGAQ